jgi:hypothetical protein
LKRKGDIRRTERLEKLNQWEKNVRKEKEYCNAITNNMETLTTMLKESFDMSKVLNNTLVTYLQFKMSILPPPQLAALLLHKHNKIN